MIRFHEVYAELRDEHSTIMALVARLGAHEGLIGLVPILEELHEALINHFSHEQFPGGLYECMGAHGSPYREDLKTLVREHCVILSSLRGVLEQARSAQPGAAGEILGRVREVVSQLHDHEDKEHTLAEKLMGRVASDAQDP